MATLDARRLYREIIDVEKQLRDLLRVSPLNAQDANVYRNRLTEKARLIAEVNPTFAAAKELEQVLWKPCFYKRIEDFRRRIRKYASASSTDRNVREHFARVSTEFQQFLADSSSFYEHLRDCFSKWLQNNRVTRIASSTTLSVTGVGASATEAAANLTKCRQSLFRCLVFLGDLARYRELHSQKAKKNFAAAESYYHKALMLMPENGNPHNQLAVLATYVEAETVAVYRYCRSLLIALPFATAEENLVLLFERSRQRPLAPPSLTPLTSASPSKDKSAFLKSFLHRLTRSHGIVFSIAAQQSPGSAPGSTYGSNATTLVYPREMESILFKDLKALLSAGVMGDALLLKVIVINIFCLVRAMGTTMATDSLRLAALTVTCVMEFLIEELNKLQGNDHPNSIRLLGPVSTFCDFLRCNMQWLDTLEAEIHDNGEQKFFASKFLEGIAAILNHGKVKEAYTPLISQKPEQQRSIKEQQMMLKENVELRGFLPLASLLDSPSAAAKWKDEFLLNPGSNVAIPEPEAFKIRAWNLYEFGKFVCEDYEGNPLLYLYNGTFSTSPVVSSNAGGSSRNGASDHIPTFSLGLLEKSSDNAPAKSPVEDDDDLDDEVIVFQPSPALTGLGVPPAGSGALGGSSNAILAQSGGFPSLATESTFSIGAGASGSNQPTPPSIGRPEETTDVPFGRFRGSIGSSLGYPNFHTFSDFSSFSNQSMLSGWGAPPSGLSGTKSDPMALSMLGESQFGDLTSKDSPSSASSGGYDAMVDLDAIERETALYQREESSLSAFFGSAGGSAQGAPNRQATARSSPPPPPGFTGGAPPPGFGGTASPERRASVGANQQFFTRNPFINP